MSYYMVLAHQVAESPAAEPVAPSPRKRARKPAGSPEGGEFVGDDPATPQNEAFTGEA